MYNELHELHEASEASETSETSDSQISYEFIEDKYEFWDLFFDIKQYISDGFLDGIILDRLTYQEFFEFIVCNKRYPCVTIHDTEYQTTIYTIKKMIENTTRHKFRNDEFFNFVLYFSSLK